MITLGQKISYEHNGQTGEGYLALPENGAGPAVIVIQEWWGLVGHITDIVDRFAAAGFVHLPLISITAKQPLSQTLQRN
jgi:carboxymethylenebutenolidase